MQWLLIWWTERIKTNGSSSLVEDWMIGKSINSTFWVSSWVWFNYRIQRKTASNGNGVKDLSFSVKLAYSKWEAQKFTEDKEFFAVWKNICPPKVEIFVWMAIQGCIASKSVLVRRGIIDNNLGRCPFCKETQDHLLLLCDVASRVWSNVISWWNMVWVCPPNLKNLLAFWDSFKFNNLEKLC